MILKNDYENVSNFINLFNAEYLKTMTETTITHQNINKIMNDMLNDPKSMSIWAEILINTQSKEENNITAKELYERLDINMSVLYTKLNKMVEEGVIEAQLVSKDTKKKKRVTESVYSISKNFIDVYNKLIMSLESQNAHVRDYRIFHLYVINSILMREIRILSEKSNEEVAKTINNEHYYGKFGSLSKSEHDLLQKKLKQVHEELHEFKKKNEDKKEENEEDYLIFDNEYFYYSGFLKLK